MSPTASAGRLGHRSDARWRPDGDGSSDVADLLHRLADGDVGGGQLPGCRVRQGLGRAFGGRRGRQRAPARTS